jgi:hypothetical protein
MINRIPIHRNSMDIHAMIIKILVSLIFSAFLQVGTLPAWVEAQNEKWVFVGFTKYRDAVFMDMNRVSHLPDQRTQVWSRITPSVQSKYFRQIQKDLKNARKDYGEFKYIEILNEVDCQNNQVRYLKVIYYGKSRLAIHATRDENPSWKPIHPGSLWDALQGAVCRK